MTNRKFFLYVFFPMVLSVLALWQGPLWLSAWAGSREGAIAFVVMVVYASLALLYLIRVRKCFEALESEGDGE